MRPPQVQLLVDGRPLTEVAAAAFIEIDKRLAAMDAQAVDMEVLSINPFWYGRERDLAGQIVKLQNEKLAELCASKPDRFAAFASLTLQAPDLAVQELETAVKKQGLKGAAIGGAVNGEAFSDPKFHPVWAKAEELGVPLFIHPQGVPELAKKFAGNGWLGNTIGNPLETTIALSHLIFEGTLDRFPKLKVIAAHGGGFLPSYADRSDHACLVSPKGCNPNIKLKKAADGISQADLFRFADLHAGGDPPSGGPGRRRSDRAGQRLSLSLCSYIRSTIFSRRNRFPTTTRPTSLAAPQHDYSISPPNLRDPGPTVAARCSLPKRVKVRLQKANDRRPFVPQQRTLITAVIAFRDPRVAGETTRRRRTPSIVRWHTLSCDTGIVWLYFEVSRCDNCDRPTTEPCISRSVDDRSIAT